MSARVNQPELHCARLARAVSMVLVVLLTLAPRSTSAQAPGSVAGRLLNAQTGAPIGSAQIYLAGSSLGTVTRADGRFAIMNVPAGTYDLRVELIGFRPLAERIVVRAEETTQVNLQLREQAVALDQLVVTGQPTAARRREIGASLTQIDLSQVTAKPIGNVETLLRGTSGVQALAMQGQVGSSGQLQLRGATSVTQRNEPLIYVDGVRLSTRRVPAAAAFDGRSTRVSGITFNELNLGDIERIEIIKGAAATALYGTEASGGVIQIFTSKGRGGPPQWSFSTSQGANFWPQLSDVINSHPTRLDIDSAAVTGWVQRYDASVRGGSETLRYFLSTSGSDERGIVREQGSKHWTVTGNFEGDVVEGLRLQWNSSYGRRETDQVADGNNRYGYMINVLRVGAGYLPGDRSHRWVLEQDYSNVIDNFVSGLRLDHIAGTLRNSVQLGLHHVEASNTGIQPFGFNLTPRGSIQVRRWQDRTLTLEYTGSWAKNLSPSLRSTLSWGTQAYDETMLNVTAVGEDFPGPGRHTVSSAARTTSTESRIRQVNAGFYVQEMVGFSDRLFLTGGLRFDGSSTFGENYGFQTYPKLSVSYVLSDAAFWPGWWESFRLRAALGEAGKAPGAFDATRTWSPVPALGGQSAVTPGNLGNPDLGPERTREIEAGFDASLWDGRVALDFTYYNAHTYDALFNVLPVPSQGFTSSQLTNAGELRNSGVELSADVLALASRTLNWRVGGSIATVHNRVVDMGGSAPFTLGPLQSVREGYPAPSFFGSRVTNPDELAPPQFEQDVYLGPVFPTTTIHLRSNISLGSLTLSALGESSRGGNIANSVAWLNTIRNVWPACEAIQTRATDQGEDVLTAAERAHCLTRYTSNDQFIETGDFFKLREVSLTFRLPERLLPPSVSSLTLGATGLNLLKISDYTGTDPEVTDLGSGVEQRHEYYVIPPMRSFLLKLSATF
jgi:TonB-dependent starch-binding outer membrane protein SusC